MKEKYKFKVRHYSKAVMRGTVNTYHRGSNPLNVFIQETLKLLLIFFFIHTGNILLIINSE